MFLTQSILRKTAADPQKVAAIVAQFEQNNPGVMRKDRVKAYGENTQALAVSQQQLKQLNAVMLQKKRFENVVNWKYRGDPASQMAQKKWFYEKHVKPLEDHVGMKMQDKAKQLQASAVAQQNNIAGFEKEFGARQDNGLNDAQIETRRRQKEQLQNVYSQAMVANLPDEYKKEGAVIPVAVLNKAKAAGLAASTAAAKQQFGWNSGELARNMQGYSGYMSAGGRNTRLKIADPKLNQAMNTVALNIGIDPNTPEGQKQRAEWEQGRAAADPNNKESFSAAQKARDSRIPVVRALGGVKAQQAQGQEVRWQNRFATAQAERNKLMNTQYADATKDTVNQYNQGRRDKITGFLKKNWLPIAGLGMGAMGLMAMWRMGNKKPAQQQRPMQQNASPQAPTVPEWAQNNKFGHGSYQTAGTQQDTLLNSRPKPQDMLGQISPMFKKFMRGRNG